MSYPLPSKVLAGVVFGAANELVGTLSPVAAAAATFVRTSQLRMTVTQRASRGVTSSKTDTSVAVSHKSSRVGVTIQSEKLSVSIRTGNVKVIVFTEVSAISIFSTMDTVP